MGQNVSHKRWHSTQTHLSYSSSYSAFSIASAQRPWSRKSRKQYQIDPSPSSSRLECSKTTWPTSLVETIFLPQFPLKCKSHEMQFEIMGKIAQGAFGSVLKVTKRDTGRIYAMKILSKSQVIRENAVQQCKDEVTIQSMLGHHVFIVKCEYYWQNRKQLFILTEYVPWGELLNLWKEYNRFSERLVQIIVAELAIALDFLHNAGVIYRDLKMENILLDGQGHIQIIDFGLSKWLSYGCKAQTICGTIQYMAPEILSMEPYSHSVDWWSLGVIMYALLTGSYPVDSADNHTDMRKIVDNTSYQLPDRFSTDCKLVVRKLLCKISQKRLQTLDNLKFEPFFRKLCFQQVYEKKFPPRDILKEDLECIKTIEPSKSVCALVEFFEDFDIDWVSHVERNTKEIN